MIAGNEKNIEVKPDKEISKENTKETNYELE